MRVKAKIAGGGKKVSQNGVYSCCWKRWDEGGEKMVEKEEKEGEKIDGIGYEVNLFSGN